MDVRLSLTGSDGQFGHRACELDQAQGLGALDVGHGQSTFGGDGDAEIHVIVDGGVAAGLVPMRVHHRVRGDGGHHCLGSECQRSERQSGERLRGTEPAEQFHRRRDIGGEEDAGLRSTGAGNHRRRHLFSYAGRGQACRVIRRRLHGKRVCDVSRGDGTVESAAGDFAQIDAGFAGRAPRRGGCGPTLGTRRGLRVWRDPAPSSARSLRRGSVSDQHARRL